MIQNPHCQNILDLNVSPSLEKCLTNELLESMADDSSNIKLRKNSEDNSNNNEQGNDLKITKKLFEQNKINNLNNEKEKNGTTFYDDNINGFEYQLIHATESISKGIIESDIHSFQRSIELCEIMDMLRNDWGMKYPFEE